MPKTPNLHIFFFSVSLFLFSCNSLEDHFPEDIIKTLPQEVDYNFYIRPILADRCFSCHGFDEEAREADLRLDLAQFAHSTGESGKSAITPKSLHKSEVFHRILSEDKDIQMPPPESKMSLTLYEKALISKWIEQGAEYKKHWAFVPLEKTKINNTSSSVNQIDFFVKTRLEKEGLSLAPIADRERLIRRLTFDLTGLPPTLEEIDHFLADSSEKAYEALVDRLLQSDAYAERMAMEWMDVSRYADSHGLHSDGWRSMYPWRDWVIKAFKQNIPYDEFITWQLAGDLLPQKSRSQVVATAFNRNHKITAEGGIVDEEYRMEYVHDRVSTTSTAFMGLTMECARCHDHKYDPLSQKDYYQLFALFNQVDELGMNGDDGNSGPNLLLPSEKTQIELLKIEDSIRTKAEQISLIENEVKAQKKFLGELESKYVDFEQDVEIHLDFKKVNKDNIDLNKATISVGEITIQSKNGRTGVEFDGEYEYIQLKEKGIFDQHEAFSAALFIYPYSIRPSQTLICNTDPKANFWRGWEFYLDSLNRLTLRLTHALPHDLIEVHTTKAISIDRWTHVAFSYDGTGKAAGVQLYIDGKKQDLYVQYDKLKRSIHPSDRFGVKRRKDLRLGKSYRAFTGEYGIYQGLMDDLWIFRRALGQGELAKLAGLEKTPPLAREEMLFNDWQARSRDSLKQQIRYLRKRSIDILDTVPEVMIMEEGRQKRRTHILNRGLYDQPLEEVFPALPSAILTYPDSLIHNRLDLANWLLSPEHPLTSRVIVNRYWQMVFGQGLVKTPHDFGLQGSLPTHPKLLDWLAMDFIESGWDIKALIKTIVMSQTYRQSSFVSKEKRALDPNNELLSRGASYRMAAEMIRDNALMASGLLVKKIGGPSVKPVQPDGLWQEKTSSTVFLLQFKADSGQARYRRSLYTFLRRTSPPPAMTAFDVPNRSVCTMQRQTTNTPMQALVLLNDPQFVEASRVLAERVMREQEDVRNQIEYAFRLLTSHFPSTYQVDNLLELYEKKQQYFSLNKEDAMLYLTEHAQYPPDESFDFAKLAAMTVVSNTILNFDEAYMKR